MFTDVDAAVRAARVAAEANAAASLGARRRWVEAMREAARKMVPSLARFAVEETGYGRIEDKLKKNTLVVDKTPGTEILRSGRVLRRRWAHARRARQLRRHRVDHARPRIRPRPSSTTASAWSRAVTRSCSTSTRTRRGRLRTSFICLNEAIVAAGGPENLLSCVGTPTIESAEALMKHPGVRLVVVTGGPAWSRRRWRAARR